MNDEEAGEVMYGSLDSIRKVYAPALGDSIGRLRDSTGMDDAQADAHLTEFAVAAHDAQLNQLEASTIHGLMATYTAKPPDEETKAQWETQARREVRTRYGDDADRRIKAVREFLAARPALAQQFHAIGSHPRFVLTLAEQADRLRPPRKRK